MSFISYVKSLLGKGWRKSMAVAEVDEEGMPDDRALVILRKLAEQARLEPGEPVEEHRRRFEARRIAFEKSFQPDGGYKI